MKVRLERDAILEMKTKEFEEALQGSIAQERCQHAEALTALNDIRKEQEEAMAAILCHATNAADSNPIDVEVSNIREAFVYLKEDVKNMMEQWSQDKERLHITCQRAQKLGFPTLEDLFESIIQIRCLFLFVL